MKSKYAVKIDFYRDWIEILENYLNTNGIIVTGDDDHKNISIKYFNLLKRYVSPIPREILISKEFSCPDSLKSGLGRVKEIISKGENLLPNLSTRITDIDYKDALLNDWGIHHIHLGTDIEQSGFINRTDDVLFARFDKDTAYFINVEGHKSWSNQKFIKILHDNWPDSISRFHLKGVHSLQHQFDDDQIALLRKAGVQTGVQIEEGIVYAPIGGGYATSGDSIESLRSSGYYADLVRSLEEHVIANVDEFVQHLRSKDIKFGSPLRFRLCFDDSTFYAEEKGTRERWHLYSLQDLKN